MSFANGYAYRRSITVDHTKVPNSNQTDFTVAVIGTYSFLAHTAHGGLITDLNGYDIAFYADEAGTTPLYWEIEPGSYNHETGAVVFHVKVSLSYTADTVFYVFYGNSGVSTFQSTAASAWDSNFKGVWHLGEVSDGSVAVSRADSLGVNNLTDNNTTASAAGKVGIGADFEDANSESLSITDAAQTGLEPGNGDMSLSLWYKPESQPDLGSPYWQVLASKWLASGNQRSWMFTYEVDGAYPGMLFQMTSTGSSPGRRKMDVTLSNGTMYHLAFAWDASLHTVRIYVNGSLLGTNATGSATSIYNGTAPFAIGGCDGNYWPDGVIDEVKYSATLRSADWFATEYANQNSPSTFYTVGDQVNGPVTGTAAVTAAKASEAISGTYSSPLKTGTAAVTAAKPAVAASGSYAPYLRTGALEVTAGKPTVEVAGTYAPPLKTGTAVVEPAKPSIAASGTFESSSGGAVVAAKPTIAVTGVFIPLVTGTAVVVAAHAAAAVAATRTSPVKTGTIEVGTAPATIAIGGAYAPPLKTGTVAVTAQAATIAAGGVFIPLVSGTATAAAAKPVVAVTGAYTPPLKTGTAAVTAAKATTAASGGFIPLKTGTAAVAGQKAVVALTGLAAGPIITGTVAVGAAKAVVTIYGDLIVLPPPSSSGARVGTWFRPAASGVRIGAWYRPTI